MVATDGSDGEVTAKILECTGAAILCFQSIPYCSHNTSRYLFQAAVALNAPGGNVELTLQHGNVATTSYRLYHARLQLNVVT